MKVLLGEVNVSKFSLLKVILKHLEVVPNMLIKGLYEDGTCRNSQFKTQVANREQLSHYVKALSKYMTNVLYIHTQNLKN